MESNETAIIVQARMGSTRLKGKILKPIYKQKTVLELLIHNLKSLNVKIIIATTDKTADKVIVDSAVKNGLDYYCGDEEDVLRRYIDCAVQYDISNIIRITSDNMFIQHNLILPLIQNKDRTLDYITYKIGEKNVVLTHWGLFGEYVTLNALKKVQRMSKEKNDIEHVTYYIYNHPEEFKIEFKEVPRDLKREDIRLTIDTIEDFNICKQIIEYLKENNLEWHYKNILNYVDNDPNLRNRMQINIQEQNKHKS